jgi:hypothetical protein
MPLYSQGSFVFLGAARERKYRMLDWVEGEGDPVDRRQWRPSGDNCWVRIFKDMAPVEVF